MQNQREEWALGNLPAVGAGGISAVLGGVVLTGWYTHNTALVQL